MKITVENEGNVIVLDYDKVVGGNVSDIRQIQNLADDALHYLECIAGSIALLFGENTTVPQEPKGFFDSKSKSKKKTT